MINSGTDVALSSHPFEAADCQFGVEEGVEQYCWTDRDYLCCAAVGVPLG